MARNQLPETDGSVAYQVYPNRLNGSAAVQPIPAALPEEKPQPKKQKAPKAKLTIAPFAAVGLAVVVFLLAMVLFAGVRSRLETADGFSISFKPGYSRSSGRNCSFSQPTTT